MQIQLHRYKIFSSKEEAIEFARSDNHKAFNVIQYQYEVSVGTSKLIKTRFKVDYFSKYNRDEI